VPAGDVDEDVATALTATIMVNQQQQPPPPSPTPADVEPSSPLAPSFSTPMFRQVTQDDNVNNDAGVCIVCDHDGPPRRKHKGSRPKSWIINWMRCDTCCQWMHNVCTGAGRTTPTVFVCLSCQ